MWCIIGGGGVSENGYVGTQLTAVTYCGREITCIALQGKGRSVVHCVLPSKRYMNIVRVMYSEYDNRSFIHILDLINVYMMCVTLNIYIM